MPGVIEAITFIVLAGQAGALGAGLAAVATAYAGTLLATGLSVGLSYLSSVIFKPEQPKPQDVQVSVKNPVAPRQRHYGRVKISGPWVFAESKSGDLHKVIALGTGELDAIEEYWLDDTVVTLDVDGWVGTSPWGDGVNDNLVRIQSRLGLATETHYSDLETVFPEWDANHRGDGVSSLYILQGVGSTGSFARRFPNGANTLYRVVARGSKVFNPSTGTTIWSDNAAAVIRDYMSHPDGMRLPAALFTTPQATAGWLAAYNRCAEAVDKKAGETEDRYRIWGSYRFDERPADVLGRMLACCDGRIIPTPDGGVTLDVGTWEEPTVVIDADVITGFSELSRGRDILTTANVISATFLSPTHDYQSTDADQWRDEDDVSARGEIVSDVSFNMAPSHGQARRLMKLAAYRANPSWIGTFQCNLKALAAFGKRFVRITYPLFEIDEVFEVVDFRFIIGEGGILGGVTLQVHSMPEEAYEWDAATEEGTEPISEDVVVDDTIPVPANFTFTENFVTVAGSSYSVGVITFDAPPSESLTPEGRYKKVSDPDTAWAVISIAEEATSAQTGVLEDSVEYEAQVRHVTITGRVGEWTDSETMTPLSNPTPPEDLVSFALTGSAPYLGNAPFSFTTQNDDNLRHVALYRVASGGVLNRTTDLVARIPVTSAASTYAYTDGDSTRVNLNPDVDFASGWTVPADVTIVGGEARKAVGAANRHLYATASPSSISTVYRWQHTITDWTAGNIFFRIANGTTQIAASSAASANGTYRGNLTNGGAGANRIGPFFAAASAADVDGVIWFEETASCAPQGDWDYYAEPLNPSGVAGSLEGPVQVTVI